MTRKRYEIIASCFDKKGRHLSTSINNYRKSHPLMKHFAILAGESEHKHALHAELGAILSARGKDIDSILVQRFDSYGKMKLSRPCPTCRKIIEAFNIRKIMYTTEKGIVKEINEKYN